MASQPQIMTAASVASLASGPAFIAFYIFATLYLQLPNPVVVRLEYLAAFAVLLMPAAIAGFVLGIGPTFLGALLMTALARDGAAGALPQSWALVGGGAAYAVASIAWPIQGEQAIVFALVATGAFCALVCWRLIGPQLEAR